MKTFWADESAVGQRLDVWLATAANESRSTIQRRLKAGQVVLDGRPARSSHVMELGDEVILKLPPAAAIRRPEIPELPIVYEDRDILVIDKPAGIAVHPGHGTASEVTVADFARPRTSDENEERPGIVHRLDKDTSGLLVIAKNQAAKEYLQGIWRRRSVAKVYQLLAVGTVKPPTAVIDLPLARDAAKPTRRTVTPGGRQAITRYTTLENYPGYSLIEARPETGRTHQLRVHFAALGHPVAGDVVYGPSARPLGLHRQFLHAAGLSLVTSAGRRLDLHSPLPPDLQMVLDHLRDA